jgi:transcriptional regulator with XRE-family HTH domain
MDNLGDRVREVRLSRGIKAKYVAAQLGVAEAWVTRREKGYVDITVKELKSIADVLGVSAKNFFT